MPLLGCAIESDVTSKALRCGDQPHGFGHCSIWNDISSGAGNKDVDWEMR